MKNRDNKIAFGYVAIMFAMLFWGLSFVWIKHLLNNNFPVFTIVFIRLVLASAVFITLLKLQKKLQKIAREDYKDFFLLAFFEPFLYFIGEDFGLQQVDASFAAVIIALIPIVISIIFLLVRGINPLRVFKAMSPAVMMALFTKSSAATLPVTLSSAEERLGASPKVSRFVLPICTTINMNGCAAFILVTSLFVMKCGGMDLSIWQMLLWVLVFSSLLMIFFVE